MSEGSDDNNINHPSDTQQTHSQSPWQGDEVPEPSTADNSDLHIRSSLSEIEDGRLPIPVWMIESSKSFHWRWIPLPIRTLARSAIQWSKGPIPPRIQKITPLFSSIQEAPLKLVTRYLPKKKHKALVLGLFYFSWLLTFSLIIRHSASSGNIEGYGQPQSLWCGASFWNGGNSCGINGDDCRPFVNAVLPFRCPADCKRIQILNPYAVGDQELNYQPLVIGGPQDDDGGLSSAEPIYRADSFICQAAVHAGIVSNDRGGCGVVSLKGKQHDFPSTYRHGIKSIGFDSEFPKSFTFISGISSECGKVDLRWPLLAVTIVFTTLLSLFTDSPAVFFSSIFTMMFFHVGLVSDRPNISDYPSLTSLIIGRFLPAAFVGFVIYHFCAKIQLSGLTAQIEKTVLYLGGTWVGCLNNYTFDKIPIQRLTPHDLNAQPGAKAALSIIVVAISIIALGQIWYLRLEGRFLSHLAIYALMGTFLIICVIVPDLNLRIHHYVLALLLLPGTGIQTRPSLLYQGILLGLFINGVARWGFDSILQTSATLFGGGQTNSLLPNIMAPKLGVSNITFRWTWPPSPYDGVSVLVNDVERHRWYGGEGEPSYTWHRHSRIDNEYFRFAYMEGSGSRDYTKAGVWDMDGNWTSMKAGPS